MSARAIAIHGNEKSGERRANLEIKSECPALLNTEVSNNPFEFASCGGGEFRLSLQLLCKIFIIIFLSSLIVGKVFLRGILLAYCAHGCCARENNPAATV